MSLGEGPLLTVGHGLDPTPIDAVAHDVLLGRRRAPVAERQVVFVGPALVAMAADPNPQARVSLEDRHLLIQDRGVPAPDDRLVIVEVDHGREQGPQDRKSTRLNSSHSQISYAVFCLKKKKNSNKA